MCVDGVLVLLFQSMEGSIYLLEKSVHTAFLDSLLFNMREEVHLLNLALFNDVFILKRVVVMEGRGVTAHVPCSWHKDNNDDNESKTS